MVGAMYKVSIHPIVRLQRLTPDRRHLLLRAALILSAMSAAVALLPFQRAIRLGAVSLGRPSSIPMQDCVWAVEAVARWLPWPAKCIQKGLAVQRLARQAGHEAVLHYGARMLPESGRLEAHVWVTVSGEAIIGGNDSAGHAEITRYS